MLRVILTLGAAKALQRERWEGHDQASVSTRAQGLLVGGASGAQALRSII